MEAAQMVACVKALRSTTNIYVGDGPSRFYWTHGQRFAADPPSYDGPIVMHIYEK